MENYTRNNKDSIDLSSTKPQILDFISNKDLKKLLDIVYYHIKDQEISKKQPKSQGLLIPLSIFSTKIPPATALVKYLKDELSQSYAQISKLINRDQRTVWTLYNQDKSKLIVEQAGYYIPITLLQNRSLSILENIVSYLIQDCYLKPRQISSLLNKNSSTIYSIINRTKNKTQKINLIRIKP